jgi:hypothetical protein
MLARSLFAFAGLFALIGCASGSDNTNSGDSSSTNQDLTSSSVAKEGEGCGGTVAHPKECASGLTCVMPDQPHAIGGTGTCQKEPDVSNEGEFCGGTVAHPKQCAPGLTCIMPDHPGVGATGTCEKDDLAKEGESCGGTVSNPRQCEPELTCVLPTPHAAGGTGTCQKRAL